MSLFQKSVEKKYLNDLDSALIDKKYADFQHYFGNPERQENIRNSKEEQFQEGFLRELFVNILGYTLNPEPNFNLTTELKNISNNKKADGAILKGDNATAVIELKGTNTTDLDKIETQAFGYKNHHPKCIYVITSNFEKRRFYIQNAVDHIDFDLFNLTKKQFSLLWLCLAKDNLLNNLPLKIKDSSVLQEENITKKLYADYSKFREAIYNNLIKNNPETDKLLLFKKTQKLLDRFLFIFFAEDRLLLPPNSISQIVNQWQTLKDELDEYVPLYSRFKKYFGYMNTGFKGKKYDIFAYNGGLFKPDKILDNILIDDDILLEHTVKLSNYDFETDVDVNILGHIFEHSLGEIAAIAATRGHVPLAGTGNSASKRHVPLTTSKRKKDGIFYTPKYITKYIVENTVGKLCSDKRNELQIIDEEYAKGRKNRKKEIVRTLDKKLDEYRNWLLTLTILDPACGSGAFLNQALEFLINEHRKIDELRTQLFGGAIVFSDITTDILEKNIFGVDINEESVEIAKLSLWLRTAQKGRKLNTLSNNIKCGNSLIDDPEIAGEKAFNWNTEFPTVFSKKKKKAWHITTATHNSRYSQRMFDNHVKLGEAIWLDEEDERLITKTIAEIVKESKLDNNGIYPIDIVEYNICGDHMHLLLVCEEEELTKIVGKIKGVSGRKYNIEKGITIPSTAASTTRGHVPLSGTESGTGKKKYNSLWTQKFGKSEIRDEDYLNNAIEYIRNNRVKHKLPKSKEIEKLKKEFLCTKEHAFRTEYKGGFDVVIGNPPYGAEFNNQEKEYIVKKYKSYQYKFESYLYFYEKGINLLKKEGILSFITPELFLRLEKSENIRSFLFNNSVLTELKFCGEDVFSDVKVNSVIATFKNSDFHNDYFQIISESEHTWNYYFSRWEKTPLLKIEYEISPEVKHIIEKIDKNSINLGRFGEAVQGITPYDSYRGHSKELIKNRGFHFSHKVDETCGKWLDGKHVKRYSLIEGNEWLRYGNWLAAQREKRFFEGPRLLFREVPGQNKRIQATYTETTYYHGHSITPFILNKNESKNIYFQILGITNSKLLSWFAKYKSSNFAKNTFPKLNPKDIKQFPIPANIPNSQSFNEKVIKILKKQQELIVNENRFVDYLQSQFSDILLNKKLQIWHELEFAEFIKELNKAIKKSGGGKLSKSDEMEWMEVFESKKEKAQTIKSEIEKTDKEIDQMVYKLYGLTEEEIKIVEES